MNVVSIMAHQDDEMRCLGTMLKCRARGDRLFFITLTDGSSGVMGDPPPSRDEAACIRAREMRRLSQALNAETLCLGEKDEFLYDLPEVRMRLIEAVRKTGADLVFTHFGADYNEDHVTTHKLVRHCCMIAALPLMPTDSPALKAHPAVFCVEPHGPIPFPATHFVDISEFEEQKIELLKNHCSQEDAMRMAVGSGFDGLCRGPDAYWGQKVGCDYAECFIQMPARGAVKPFAVLP